nr:MAG TPA: hypothetical protein [Caudoviricetes sp.]
MKKLVKFLVLAEPGAVAAVGAVVGLFIACVFGGR